MRTTIVGGGIGGTATAMALQRVGIDSVVLEGRPRGHGAGSWLTVSPNGLASLREIDALDAVRPLGVPTRANILVSGTGRELGRIGLGSPLDDGTVALSFHRAELASALLAEAERRGIEVRYDARVRSVETGEASAVARLADGSQVVGDVLVGADGIRSVVRRAIDPDAPDGRYVGLVNFGGVTEAAAAPSAQDAANAFEPEAWTMVFGRRAFFGALPTPGGDVVWFANLPRPAVSEEERSATSPQAWLTHLAELAAADDSAFAPLIAAGRLELAADDTHDLPRVPRWHRGRLVLLGDALHAPAPSSGQGASMALEDAVALASALGGASDPTVAFAAYEARRRPRVERIVRDGARASSTKTPTGVGLAVRDAMLRLVFRHVVTERSQAWKLDHRERLS